MILRDGWQILGREEDVCELVQSYEQRPGSPSIVVETLKRWDSAVVKVTAEVTYDPKNKVKHAAWFEVPVDNPGKAKQLLDSHLYGLTRDIDAGDWWEEIRTDGQVVKALAKLRREVKGVNFDVGRIDGEILMTAETRSDYGKRYVSRRAVPVDMMMRENVITLVVGSIHDIIAEFRYNAADVGTRVRF